MKLHYRKVAGAALMTVASLCMLASPTLVLSLPSIRTKFEQSGWALTHRDSGLGCVFNFDWNDRIASSWLTGFLLLGVIGVFSGLVLFRLGPTRGRFT